MGRQHVSPVYNVGPTVNNAPKDQLETIRLHQANERTMLAWVRTGIALMAFGFAIARFAIFLQQVESLTPQPHIQHNTTQQGGSAWVGAILVALGMFANLGATIRFAQIKRGIEQGQVGAPNAIMVYAFGAIATVVGLLMTVLLLRSIGLAID